MNENVPCFKTLQNQLVLINEETIKKINDQVLAKARKQKLTTGKRMRVDSTVTEMNIHYPTDASLIKDGIRVINRLIKKTGIKNISLKGVNEKLKRPLALLRTIGRRNKEVATAMLKEIVTLGDTVVEKTKHIKEKLISGFRKSLKQVIHQGKQVIKGTTKIKNRVVSIFELTARAIRRGKAGKSTEFGQVVQIQEDEAFVTNWQISGMMQDEAFLPKALKKHKQLFQKYPREAATDRGYWSEENYALLKKSKVKQISLPKKGKLSTKERRRERSNYFQKLQRWRAGGEAKISWLKRKFGLNRSLYKGAHGFELWVGAGILANNLTVMTKMLVG